MAVWKLEHPSPAEIVDAIRSAATREDAVSRLTLLGLTAAQADDAIDIVGAASSRAHLLSTGIRPNQFQGDLEDDPLFLIALRRAGHNLGLGATNSPGWRAHAFLIAALAIVLAVAIAIVLRLLALVTH